MGKQKYEFREQNKIYKSIVTPISAETITSHSRKNHVNKVRNPDITQNCTITDVTKFENTEEKGGKVKGA